MNRRQALATGIGAALFTALLLGMPGAAAEGFGQGVELCLSRVLPALFPFFVVSNLLAALPAYPVLLLPLRPVIRACRLPDSAAGLLLFSWLGGYAVCAQLTGQAVRRNQLTAPQAQRLLLAGCCSSPGFVAGCVGGLMLGSVQLGVLLYGLQLAANLLAAATLAATAPNTIFKADGAALPARTAGTEPVCLQPSPGWLGALSGAISAAVNSCLSVCGCVLFFRVLSALLQARFLLQGAAGALLPAVLEVTAGCDAFAALGGRMALQGCCACLSMLGLSVFAQVRQLAGPAISLRVLCLSRLFHLVWLQLLVFLTAPAVRGVLPAYSSLQSRLVVTSRLPPDAALMLGCFLCAVLYKIGHKFYNIQKDFSRRSTECNR